jgi:hypothetical protein
LAFFIGQIFTFFFWAGSPTEIRKICPLIGGEKKISRQNLGAHANGVPRTTHIMTSRSDSRHHAEQGISRPKRDRQQPSVFCSSKGKTTVSQAVGSDDEHLPINQLLKKNGPPRPPESPPPKQPARARPRIISPAKKSLPRSAPTHAVDPVLPSQRTAPKQSEAYPLVPCALDQEKTGVRHFASWWHTRTIVDSLKTIMLSVMMASVMNPIDLFLLLSHTIRAVVLVAYVNEAGKDDPDECLTCNTINNYLGHIGSYAMRVQKLCEAMNEKYGDWSIKTHAYYSDVSYMRVITHILFKLTIIVLQ